MTTLTEGVYLLEWLFSEEFPGNAENCGVCHNDTIDHQPSCWIGKLIVRFVFDAEPGAT